MYIKEVATLILLESFLQYHEGEWEDVKLLRRNPYFIGILSAIKVEGNIYDFIDDVAILILLESFLQYELKR